jgi:hypothetical protein
MWDRIRRTFLDAIDRTAVSLAKLLPGLVVLILCLATSILLALLLKRLVARICARLELDRRLREWGMAQPSAEGRSSPSELLEKLVKWTILSLGFVVGLAALESTTTTALAATLLEYVPRVFLGFFVLMAGMAGARAVERRILIEAVNMGLQSARLIGLGVRTLVVVLAIALALEQIGLGGSVVVVSFGILFGGIVLALALAVGLGAKDAVARSLERHLAAPKAQRTDEGATEQLRHL